MRVPVEGLAIGAASDIQTHVSVPHDAIRERLGLTPAVKCSFRLIAREPKVTACRNALASEAQERRSGVPSSGGI
jgi:hypothetical protein